MIPRVRPFRDHARAARPFDRPAASAGHHIRRAPRACRRRVVDGRARARARAAGRRGRPPRAPKVAARRDRHGPGRAARHLRRLAARAAGARRAERRRGGQHRRPVPITIAACSRRCSASTASRRPRARSYQPDRPLSSRTSAARSRDSARDIVLIAADAGRGRRSPCCASSCARPRFRLTSVVHHLDRVGLQAVPIILLITFLLGAHHRAAGHLPLPPVRRRALRRRHDRHPGAARDRRHHGGDHGGGPLGQRLHGRARLHEDARGDRRAAHHGLRPGRGAGAAAADRAGDRAADPHLPRLDGGALRRRPGVLALWRRSPRRSSSRGCATRSRSTISPSA